MRLQTYLKADNIDEGQKMDIYTSLTNSVDTALRIIDLVMSEDSEDVKNLKRLQSAKAKLESAQHDIKMIPMEALKNVVVKGWNTFKSGLKQVFT
jgi:hypothetical protein